MKDLQGRTAVVTGGGGGIGRGVALALGAAGMNVVTADVSETAASAVADELTARGVSALGVGTDVTDRGSVARLADLVYAKFGSVDVLHNNAGVGLFARLDETTDNEWQRILDVNVRGVINCLQVFLPRITAQGSGAQIVNTASMAGIVAAPWFGAYNASKSAVVAISETLRSELAPLDIGVSVLCPGGVNTDLVPAMFSRRSAAAVPESPIGGSTGMRMLEPELVGEMVRHGIEANEPYIITHPEMRVAVERRFTKILSAFSRAEARDGTFERSA